MSRDQKRNRYNRPNCDDLRYFRQLNQICLDLQKATYNEILDISQTLVGRLEKKDAPFLSDFEVEVVFKFYLSENSTEWRDDSDNIVALIRVCDCVPYGDVDSDFERLRDDRSWHDWPDIECSWLSGEKICYIANKLIRQASSNDNVHQIYEIDTVWSDIHLRLQGVKYHPTHQGEKFCSSKPGIVKIRR